MKFIKVTVIDTLLSESGERKMTSLGGSSKANSHLDQYGHSIEKYEDMGIPIPEDSTHNTTDEFDDENITLEDDDLEFVKSVAYFLAEDFKLVVERTDFGSTIYLKGDMTLDVLESPLQIINKLKKS